MNRSRLSTPTYDVEFVDLPGERFVDTAMLGRTFYEWSEWLLASFESDPYDRATTLPLLQLLEAPAFDELTLIQQYKRVLYRLTKRQRRLVTPSTFLLDTAGIQAPALDEDKIVSTRHSGLPGHEFAPMSDAAAQRHPALAKQFAAHFEAYKAGVVFPFYKSFRYCDRLLVAVDLPKILMSGPGLLNDTVAVAESIVDAACPPAHWLYRMLLTLGRPVFRPKVIQHVCFVALKADLCGTGARRDMKRLLEQMLASVSAKLRGVAKSFHAVAAIVSTESGPVGPQSDCRELHARLMFLNGKRQSWTEGEQSKYEVRCVPGSWPDDWNSGDYLYPTVFPKVPRPTTKARGAR